MKKRHIKNPVTLTPDQAERLYRASCALDELAYTSHPDSPIPLNTLGILAAQLMQLINENSHFQFED